MSEETALAKREAPPCARCDNKREFKVACMMTHEDGRRPTYQWKMLPCPTCTETERLKALRERAAQLAELNAAPGTKFHDIAARIRALLL